MSNIRSLFVMDPFNTIAIKKDTTYVMMREAQNRGHAVYACFLDGLGSRSGKGFAAAMSVEVTTDPEEPIRALSEERILFDDLDVIFMRKDPPFNMKYVFATYLLDGADPSKTLVVNRPSGLRDANEKCFTLQFPSATPKTMVTSSAVEIRRFMQENDGKCIIKPLDLMGGYGVFLLSEGDPNLSGLIESSTEEGRKYVMVQTYVPEAKLGDKRIIVIDGEPVGATLRVPAKGELRGNIHVGAVCEKTEITPRDREICEIIAPELRKRGLYFAGIDVLGDYLTEINVTSPTGFQEINRLNQVCIEGMLWDWVEGALPG
ncbi:MAG: glutathione synthase [Myxococcales bacterium]|nr:glutathione synthase [Myxococcales bacterium]